MEPESLFMETKGTVARGKRARQHAYTLPEVMIAVLALATIASAFYLALSSGFLITQNAREDLRATQIMTQKLEGLRLCTWSQLSNYSFQEPYDPLARSDEGAGVTYNGRVSISPAGALPSGVPYRDNMCLVTVSLDWTNHNGRTPVIHSRKAQTHFARYGLQGYVWGGFRQNVVIKAAGRTWEVAE